MQDISNTVCGILFFNIIPVYCFCNLQSPEWGWVCLQLKFVVENLLYRRKLTVDIEHNALLYARCSWHREGASCRKNHPATVHDDFWHLILTTETIVISLPLLRATTNVSWQSPPPPAYGCQSDTEEHVHEPKNSTR